MMNTGMRTDCRGLVPQPRNDGNQQQNPVGMIHVVASDFNPGTLNDKMLYDEITNDERSE